MRKLKHNISKRRKREDARKILIAFARPLTDSFNYRFLTKEGDPDIDFLEIFSYQKDSLTIWLKDSTVYKNDTLTLELNYTVKDSMELNITRTDTLLMTFRKRISKQKKDTNPPEEKLTISTLRDKGDLDLNANLKLEFNIPLVGIQDSLIHLWQIPDSVEVPLPFHAKIDSMVPSRAWIDARWEEITNYHLQILPGAFTSLYELEHDTLDISFRTRDSEYYGQVLLTLYGVSSPVIIQLTSREQVVRQLRIYKSGLVYFQLS